MSLYKVIITLLNKYLMNKDITNNQKHLKMQNIINHQGDTN